MMTLIDHKTEIQKSIVVNEVYTITQDNKR